MLAAEQEDDRPSPPLPSGMGKLIAYREKKLLSLHDSVI